jgi:hypothetical protein
MYELLSPLTFRTVVEVSDQLREHTDHVNRCRELRGLRWCSECPVFNECDLLKSLLRARFAPDSGGGGKT